MVEWGERVQGTGRVQGAAARVALGPIPVSEDQSHWSNGKSITTILQQLVLGTPDASFHHY
ncbi:hypothetical protein C8R44DRAFT_887163 [Mycena epipterygia]|nr:hypothetical protein C8R44DRAFT_887163 [Mycena epipterygia]